MKKIFALLLVVFSVISFSEISISFGISFGNLEGLSDYSLVIVTGESFMDVYVDGEYMGQTDIFGQFIVTFEESGYHFVEVQSEDYIVFSRMIFIRKEGVVLKLKPIKAGRIVVFSNVYPINVYIDGIFWGEIKNENEELKLPIGEYKVMFSSPGYEKLEKELVIDFKRVTPVELFLKKLPLEMYLRSDYNEFSPNGDWYRDNWELEILLTTFSTVTVDIYKGDLKIDNYVFSGVPGVNLFKWNGVKEEGDYLVKVSAYDEDEIVTKSTNVKINMKYTYLKELVIISLLSLVGVIVYSIVK
ncbi:hypothetical protein SU69_07860 [Thermosipho melanesiensis]|uniref:Uncharacterized protein n=2 Tax=Thermosipho melanesiensis TaxID=46541 RepID=A6LN92_THEM4|nr:PEGA domain-containing protein [Thermosipho melanesiensis]ABR31393.1 hypothetical protein Tmel_1548 [Thermosipho melanesiensis BI429]APT74453.1 hypothetical protein BW47_08215 [Thermosipho melanesiensis]OOC36414.1 hypothetical protein SU68_07930 [Thermosipho melanesiensis]OOC37232.1 hypothetical protein SU69_07860 [Thermosipho melanesiensis]OOC37984.1 hypothetical protein SU70_07870 [Thermosipho melanesiensis]